MKKLVLITQITAVIMLICCGIFMYPNFNVEVSLINPEMAVPLWVLKGGSFVVGILIGVALSGIYLLKQSEKFSALERRNEKKEIKADSADAKIKVLENKIASLEKALEKALGK